MKRIALMAVLVLALTACASDGSNTAPPPAGFDASASQFTGWARVTGEEFQLFAEQRDLRTARNAQRAAGDISGSQVRFTGRTMAWAERNQGQSHDWQGSNITNGCRKDVIIMADRVEVLR